ncbi:hypothetical protein [Polynucleobacter sp.]|uniref:hypothetical protein n=1 Tax=Polynucleobacter sp. TaxID=2029855 RepID=UPI003F6978AC
MAIDFSDPRFQFSVSRVRAYRERNCCGLMEAKAAIKKSIILQILAELKVPSYEFRDTLKVSDKRPLEDRFNKLIDVLETLVNDRLSG